MNGKKVFWSLVVLTTLCCLCFSANAMTFMGRTKYFNQSVPSYVNATLTLKNQVDWSTVGVLYNDSIAADGSYILEIPDAHLDKMMALKIYAYTSATHEKIDARSPPNLGEFPSFMFQQN
ncbi:MAG: hypothetical protein GF334_04280, partial [Candidatus Altiarchaeales archaeon]|nr:hypothetical protein [Candidatus Altiarchaeales archaeon]